jgi:hypothetical protein
MAIVVIGRHAVVMKFGWWTRASSDSYVQMRVSRDNTSECWFIFLSFNRLKVMHEL